VRYRGRRLALLSLLLVLAVPTAASATIMPTLTLTPTTLPAGTTHALGLNLSFAPSLGDSPTNLNLTLPAGLVLNENLDGGACLTSAAPVAGCELASATATATLLVPEGMSLWLVKPPSPLDIAGAALVSGANPTGAVQATAAVTLRTTPDVGLDLSFPSLPSGASALSALDLTLTGVRAPTSCPSPAATVGVSAESSGGAGAQTASAPLTVTGCASLPYAPVLSATVARDVGDSGATFSATVTGPATQSATKAFEFDVPSSISPNPNAALACLLGTACVIGSASASSPFLPTGALTNGVVNLGGSVLAPTLTVGFPPPYPVSFTGTVDTSSESLTFTNIPDLPLTSLTLAVGGGSAVKLFTTTCAPGSLAVKLTPWNSGTTQAASTPITFGGSCPATPTTPGTPRPASRAPTVSAASLRGLVKRAAIIRFTANEGTGAAPIKRIALTLPRGLALSSTKGVTVRNARGRTVRFSAAARRGVLTVTLSAATAHAGISIGPRAIAVSASLAKRARTELRRKQVAALRFGVRVTDSAKLTTGLALKLKPKS
jgi:hypothetical protein